VSDAPSIDLGVAYGAARRRIAALVADRDSAAPVPATPEWDVHDVVAHVTGVAADGTSGNMAGAPGDVWTAAQVERNRGRAIVDMLAEWDTTGPLMEAFLSSPTGSMAAAAVLDIHTHEADLRHALGLPLSIPADVVAWAGHVLRTSFADQVAAAGLPEVAVTTSDVEWFRGRLGRRTVDEVCAYSWSRPPADYLDAWFVFGRATASLGEG
jgi:uncharacterized protein (TIGR03083 family)